MVAGSDERTDLESKAVLVVVFVCVWEVPAASGP